MAVIKPNYIQTDQEVDLSAIDWNSQSTSGYRCVMVVDQLQFILCFYPARIQNAVVGHDADRITAKPGYYSLYFRTTKLDDHRKIQFTVRHVNRTWITTHPVCEFKHRGWLNFIRSKELKKAPIISVNIKLYHNPSFVEYKPKMTFVEQLEAMHKISQAKGDITLMVQLQSDEENDAYDLYVPATKKRKTDHNTDNRNNKNQNVNCGIDDNSHEIKISSCILRAASNVFDKILSNGMQERKENKIVVHAKTVKDVHDLTWFMSTNALKQDCNPIHLIALAHFYEMDRLFYQCVNKMIKTLSVKNFVQTIQTFDKYEISKGYQSLVDFAKSNIAELKQRNDFLLLSHSFRCGVLKL
eukprot:16249_1